MHTRYAPATARLRQLALGLFLAGTLAVGGTTVALAAPNPSGTGQPNQSCEEQTQMPNGFNTDGFAHATTVYAGSGVSASTAGSGNAVSQYDVACYQVSNNGR